MVSYLETVLRDGGVAAENIAKLPNGETVGMLVRVPGSDRNAKPILFSAHMDVVDARPEDWKRDPYRKAAISTGAGPSTTRPASLP